MLLHAAALDELYDLLLLCPAENQFHHGERSGLSSIPQMPKSRSTSGTWNFYAPFTAVGTAKGTNALPYPCFHLYDPGASVRRCRRCNRSPAVREGCSPIKWSPPSGAHSSACLPALDVGHRAAREDSPLVFLDLKERGLGFAVSGYRNTEISEG